MKSREIFEECPDLPLDGYCERDYWVWEEKIARPALEAKGWTVGQFRSLERDSFGPLIRGVNATKDGQTVCFWYG